MRWMWQIEFTLCEMREWARAQFFPLSGEFPANKTVSSCWKSITHTRARARASKHSKMNKRNKKKSSIENNLWVICALFSLAPFSPFSFVVLQFSLILFCFSFLLPSFCVCFTFRLKSKWVCREQPQKHEINSLKVDRNELKCFSSFFFFVLSLKDFGNSHTLTQARCSDTTAIMSDDVVE